MSLKFYFRLKIFQKANNFLNNFLILDLLTPTWCPSKIVLELKNRALYLQQFTRSRDLIFLSHERLVVVYTNLLSTSGTKILSHAVSPNYWRYSTPVWRSVLAQFWTGNSLVCIKLKTHNYLKIHLQFKICTNTNKMLNFFSGLKFKTMKFFNV